MRDQLNIRAPTSAAMLRLLTTVLPMSLLLFAAAPAATADPLAHLAQSSEERLNQEPMVIFIAEGPPNSCGPGCNRWIAAEGKFDRYSAQRVIKFLEEHKELRLPVYFHSTGGLLDRALEIGRHLRSLRMQAGVGRTALQRCIGSATSQDCRRLIEKTSDRLAQLRSSEGLCASACTYAFLGASSRAIDPHARIGVHATMPARKTEKGFVAVAPSRLEWHEATLHEKRMRELRLYIARMGADPALVDFANKIDPSSIRILNRDELARFGVTTTNGFQTPWIGRDEDPSTAYTLLKILTRQSPDDERTYLTIMVGLTCYRRERVTMFIERELAAGEIGNEQVIRVASDDKVLWTSKNMSALHSRDDYRAEVVPFETVLKALPKQSLILTIDFTSPEWPEKSTTIKLSIAGLETAIAKMRKRCEEIH
jgi:hypothetical protein